ncbi:vascular endothelial growth factor receptor 1 isoform X2 [Anabrus simplex]|uniref:vascular endothelial growth factor receptor 1 isoform X2 n=1 Tax=Anabrus simplex TaxID=316456 RepID=UPI0035A274E4
MRVLTAMVEGSRRVLVVLLSLHCMVSFAVQHNAALLPQVPSFLPGAPVTNLTVKAELLSHSIHLRISWIPPTNSSVPEGYSLPARYVVHVSLKSTGDPYCTGSTALRDEVYVDDPTVSLVLVPPQHTRPHSVRMTIKQQCSYYIQIRSNPSNFHQAVNMTYTVPECVEKFCRCHPEKIPVPSSLRWELLATGDMNVSWVLSNHRNAAYVRLQEEVFQSAGNQPVFGPVWDRQVNTSTALVPEKSLVPGHTYLLDVKVITTSGCQGRSANITLTVPRVEKKPEQPGGPKIVLIAVLLVLSLTLALGCGAVVMFWRRCGAWSRRLQPIHRWQTIYKTVSMESRLSRVLQERNVLYVEKEIEEAKLRGEVDKFEVSYSRLQLGRQIGKGAFGCVFLARAHAIAGCPGLMTVAVKKLKQRATPEEVEEFLAEIAMLKRVGRHPNVVTLLGCCTLQEPYCMLMEYVPCGDLLRYLRRMRTEYERYLHRPAPRYVDLQLSSTSDSEGSYIQPDAQCTLSSGRPSIAETECTLLSWDTGGQKLECVLDSQELHNFALQIARGMAYLELKQITHRDLAARNVLIDEHKTLKISDFGLSRSGVYVNTRRNKVPLRWLSVEAMRDHLYSNKSDVWAFGVVLWEIGTLGGFPYPTVEDTNLLRFLLDGRRLDKPDNCSDELYRVMLMCWSHCPDERPTFAELVTGLHSLVSRNRAYVDFRSLPSEYVLPPPHLVPEVVSHKLTSENSDYKSSN